MKKHNRLALNRAIYQSFLYAPVSQDAENTSKSNHEFMVTDKVVACFFRHPDYEKPFKGIAKLDPADEFSLETGKKWATTRAHIKFHKRYLRDLEKQLEIMEDVYALEYRDKVKHMISLENLEATLKRLHEEAEVKE